MYPSIPLPQKTVTFDGDSATTSINADTILSVRATVAACRGFAQTPTGVRKFTSTATVANFIPGWPNISVTDASANEPGVVYLAASQVGELEAGPVNTRLYLKFNQYGIENQPMDVSETLAQVQALLAAAASGGTGQQVTTGATAVVVNQSNVNVVTVTSPGQVVQLSDLFPDTLIINSSASYFLVKPPTGSAIDTLSTNSGIRVLGYSSVRFSRITATSWVSAVQNQSAQTYASALTATATVVTARVALLSTSATALTNFYQYGDSSTGEIPPFGRWTNSSTATTAKVKFAGGFIDGTGTLGGTAIATPYEIPAGCTVNFAYSHALGKVIATGNDVIRGTATLVLGAFTFDATSIGTVNASRISATSRVSVTGVSATNAGTLATRFLPTIVANTSIVIQGYDAAGASLATDVSTIYYEIHL